MTRTNVASAIDKEEPPLKGVRVIEFTHMVMGPSVGAILAELGADVIKVEPIGGDQTRRLLGSGAGYFPMFNRGKRSLCLDLKSATGIEIARRLINRADVLIENYRPGTLSRLGLGADRFSESNPSLISCSAKGFLTGPYEDRTALDEVTQMMGGLAYMTGPPGRPLRAGASVIDITGGMFGVIGILAALERRHRTGLGGEVRCGLFETTAYLVGQHMAQEAVTGVAPNPMPARLSAWAIYDVFETFNSDEQLFVGVVSDAQWTAFGKAFDLGTIGTDPRYIRNNDRVLARDVILPVVRALFVTLPRDQLAAKLETLGLPFAPIMRPTDLFDDPHLNASGGLADVSMPDGSTTKLPTLPIELDGKRLNACSRLPAIGSDTEAILLNCGYSVVEVAAWREQAIVA